MELRLTPFNGEKSLGEVIKVNSCVFNAPFNEPLIHQAVIAYLDSSKSLSKALKSRSQVRASNAKPWRQKGTGRARAGSVKSPLWRGGGVTFASASKKTHDLKLNRKMRKGALRSILSELIRQERLFVTEQLSLEAPKTGILKKILWKNGFSNVLIVLEGNRRLGIQGRTPDQEAVFRAASNLPTVLVLESFQVDPVSLVRAKNVLFTKAALIQLEEMLS
jgi:large subunit ribosomal protein L4